MSAVLCETNIFTKVIGVVAVKRDHGDANSDENATDPLIVKETDKEV